MELIDYKQSNYMDFFKSIVDVIPVPAAITTFDCYEPLVLHTNALHEGLTGYTSDELYYKSPRIFQPIDMDKSEKWDLKERLTKDNYFCNFVHNVNKNGERYYMKLTITSIRSPFDIKFYIALKEKF